MTAQHSLPDLGRSAEIPLWRKVIFASIASGGILALVVLASEMGLRLTGYGDSQSFFISSTEDSLAANPRFAYRYFGKSVPPRDTNWVLVPAVKPAGTYRIFILGGSAALGVPSPDFHFGRLWCPSWVHFGRCGSYFWLHFPRWDSFFGLSGNRH